MGSNIGREGFQKLSEIVDVVGVDVETVDRERLSWLTWRFYEVERNWKFGNKGTKCPPMIGNKAMTWRYEPCVP